MPLDRNPNAPAVDAPLSRRREWMLLAVLTAVQFVHVVDFVVIMPLAPQLMRDFAITPAQFGLVVSAYTFSAAAAGLAAAFALDRADRKTALLVLLAGFALGTLLCGLAPSYPLLAGARVVAGAFGGVLQAVVFAVIGDQIPAARRGAATGIVMAGFSVASTLGVPIGLEIANRYDWHGTFLVLAAVTAGLAGVAALALPSMRGHIGGEHRSPLRVVAEVFREPVHLRAFAFSITILFSGFTIAPYIAPYLVANAGMEEAELRYVYLLGGLFTLVSGPVAGRLADRYGHARVFTVSALLSITPVLLLTSLPPVPLWVALAVTTTLMVMQSGRWVPAIALITGSVEPRRRGGFMSVNSSIQQATAGVAALLAGTLVGGSAATGLTGFWRVGVLSSAAIVVAIPLAHRLRRAQQAVADAAALRAAAPPVPAAEPLEAVPPTPVPAPRRAVQP